jgi:hypothetical protein
MSLARITPIAAASPRSPPVDKVMDAKALLSYGALDKQVARRGEVTLRISQLSRIS